MTTIYVYANSKGIKCLGQKDADAEHDDLIDDGYKYIASINACRFIEHLYNQCDSTERLKQIEALGGEKL
jgi:hypothetical protein